MRERRSAIVEGEPGGPAEVETRELSLSKE